MTTSDEISPEEAAGREAGRRAAAERPLDQEAIAALQVLLGPPAAAREPEAGAA